VPWTTCHPFFVWGVLGVWGWREGFCFSSCVWCGEWTVHCSLSTWTVNSWLSRKVFLVGHFGEPRYFHFFWVIGKSNWPIVEKNQIEWTWEAPHLTSAKPQVPTVYSGGISPGEKWWWTVLEREISCSQWEVSPCTHDGPGFFLFEWVGGEEFFKKFPCS